MKQWIAAALCCLLLAGCGKVTPEPTCPTPPVSTVTTTYSDGTTQRMEQVYDENGRMIRADHYNGEKLAVSYDVQCDAAGRPVKMQDSRFGTGVTMAYTYDESGNTTRIETSINDAVYFIQAYTYNASGEKTSYIEEDLRSSSIMEYKYIYEEGVMRWEECYENQLLQFSWEYTWDEGGRRVSGTLRDGDHKENGSREYRYEDSQTTVITYDGQGQINTTKITQYNADGTVMKESFTHDGETTVTEYTYYQGK